MSTTSSALSSRTARIRVVCRVAGADGWMKSAGRVSIRLLGLCHNAMPRFKVRLRGGRVNEAPRATRIVAAPKSVTYKKRAGARKPEPEQTKVRKEESF